MKISKRSLLIVFSLMLALTTSALGTVAYMTDRATVTNTFTVGNINIIVDEKDWDNSQTGVNPDRPGRDQANSYTLIPGLEQDKDPAITVLKGSEECYVRMRVTLNCYTALLGIAQKYGDATDEVSLLEQFVSIDKTNWEYKKSGINQATDTMTYEYWYKTEADSVNAKVDAAAVEQNLPALFSTFTVPIYFVRDDLNAIKNLVMDVDGDAVQTAAFKDAAAAWEAFDYQVFGIEPTVQPDQGDENDNTTNDTTDDTTTNDVVTGGGDDTTPDSNTDNDAADGGELTGA